MSSARPSALLNAYRSAGAEIGAVAGMATGLRLASPGDAGPWLVELTPVSRALLIGSGAKSALEQSGLSAPALFGLKSLPLCEIAQVAPSQFLVSALPADPTALPYFTLNQDSLLLTTEYAEFAVGGPGALALIEEIATADSSAAGATVWFPTQICGLDAVLRREPAGFRVLCAPAEGPWLGEALLERVSAAGGGLLGYLDYLDAPP